MPTRCPLLALTMGDPAGVGPELLVRAIHSPTPDPPAQLLLIACPETIRKAAALHGITNLPLTEIAWQNSAPDNFRRQIAAALQQKLTPLCNPTLPNTTSITPRTISAAAGDSAFRCLSLAADLALSLHIDAIVTAPLNKEALHLAGHHYPGHTEILAERCGVTEFAMMLHLPDNALAPLRQLLLQHSPTTSLPTRHGLSIAHVTLHTSVASVPGLLTPDSIAAAVRLMDHFLKSSGCQRRSIAVCALNPHGGEHGLFGDEEARIIEPALNSFAGLLNVRGPLPADTAIRRAVLGEFDGVIAMYHDQGHIPVKLIGFDAAINITLGLPIIRTSPTHGTAFDIAWQPHSSLNPAGFIGAIEMAAQLTQDSSQ